MVKRAKVLTWHIHGSYLYYLSQANCDFFLPVKKPSEEGYGGKTPNFNWNDNVFEVKAEEIKDLSLDCVLFQSPKNYFKDQYEILSEKQRKSLSKFYLEHNPPRESPTDTKHWVNDPGVTLINVTHFNDLMWDSQIPSLVIEHGVFVPKNISYKGEIEKGVVVINNLSKRGRRLGLDIFEKIRKKIPLDLIGTGSEELGGLGEISLDHLFETISHYRFFFNPVRYTSLGLAVLEAMTVGLPIVGLATTEMPTVITNGFNGFVDTNINFLINKMRLLLNDYRLAKRLSQGSKEVGGTRFSIKRFAKDWEELLIGGVQ